MPLMVFHADLPSKLWIDDKENLQFAKKMLSIPYYTNTLIPINYAFVNMLLVMRKAVIALILTIIRGGLYIGYTFIFYKFDKKNPIKLMYAYNCDDSTLFLLGAALVIPQIIYIVRQIKNSNRYQVMDNIKQGL